MSNSKKLMLTALAVIFLIGATPLFAELDGIWEGYGEGSCETPAGIIIYPWQTWNGSLESWLFTGHWQDLDGSSGGFQGAVISLAKSVEPPYHTVAHCEGTWTWMDPSGLEPLEMGPFNMEFNLDIDTCWGNWYSYSSPGIGGTMWGWRIGD
ncbi:hypothetical protein CEE36_02925 [candidate division TA06 bacterium B3_TA06]|uniref:Uncharacterized protein n=1 Tax=candidate division TA06 bacterium B3_TA06 TaxID=2012487 RepID=A0A532V8W3_UNCT6|nr:MAG: hypothetical protein CEE36_02925 [candidate division TA06 bacterium B3_TA06]